LSGYGFLEELDQGMEDKKLFHHHHHHHQYVYRISAGVGKWAVDLVMPKEVDYF
jgi:hypothetical protein